MNHSDVKPDRLALQKRETQVQQLIRQMKLDQLHDSAVYQKLKQELTDLKRRLLQFQ